MWPRSYTDSAGHLYTNPLPHVSGKSGISKEGKMTFDQWCRENGIFLKPSPMTGPSNAEAMEAHLRYSEYKLNQSDHNEKKPGEIVALGAINTANIYQKVGQSWHLPVKRVLALYNEAAEKNSANNECAPPSMATLIMLYDDNAELHCDPDDFNRVWMLYRKEQFEVVRSGHIVRVRYGDQHIILDFS